MYLTDILSKEEWEQFEKDLFDRFQMNCTVYNSQGAGITGKPHWCNRLCPQIKANKESLAAICAAGNQYFMAQARISKMAVIDECDAGLIKIAVPIFIGQEFMGTSGGCGLLPEGGAVETFLVEKTTGLSEAEVLERCKGLGTMDKARAEKMVAYIEKRMAKFVDDYQKMNGKSRRY